MNPPRKSLMEEISNSLRNTIKKYSDIELDNDLTIVPSVDGEESKLMVSKDSLGMNYVNRGRMMEYGRGEKTSQLMENGPMMKMSNSYGESREYYDNREEVQSFEQKAHKFLNGLSDFEQQLNKDFDCIESMIEGSLDHELKNIKTLI